MNNKSYFDEIAHQWDEMRASFFSENVRNKALAAAGVQNGKLAADIGSGTGFITEGLVREGLRVIAVDSSPAMLEEMKQKFNHLDGIEYRIGEGEHLPISDESVDYAFANMYLHHVQIPMAALAEMNRILKVGGKLVITDLDTHGFEFLRAEHHDLWMGFRHQNIYNWLLGAGFKNVVVRGIGEDCSTTSNLGDERAKISIFVASGEK